MKQVLLIFALIVSALFSYAQSDFIATTLQPTFENQVIHHTYYSLEYSEEHEQPFWVYYTLSPAFINGTEELIKV